MPARFASFASSLCNRALLLSHLTRATITRKAFSLIDGNCQSQHFCDNFASPCACVIVHEQDQACFACDISSLCARQYKAQHNNTNNNYYS